MKAQTRPDFLTINEKAMPVLSAAGQIFEQGYSVQDYKPLRQNETEAAPIKKQTIDTSGYVFISLTRWLRIMPNPHPDPARAATFSVSIYTYNDHAHLSGSDKELGLPEKLGLLYSKWRFETGKDMLKAAKLHEDDKATAMLRKYLQNRGVSADGVLIAHMPSIFDVAQKILNSDPAIRAVAQANPVL